MDSTAWRNRLGERVVVRRRLGDGASGDGTLGDVLGELTGVDTHLHVRTRSGTVAVPLDTVVSGKVVPPRPVRRGPAHLVTSITDLQAVMSLHWRPEQRERHGGWVLRASGGFTNRANSVLPLGEPQGEDVTAALLHVVDWYAVRRLPPTAAIASAVPGGVPDDHGPAGPLRRECEATGWHVVEGGSALVMTALTAQLLRPVVLPPELALDVADTPDEQWLATYRYRGRDLSPHARPLLVSAPSQAFFSVRDGGTTVAVARGSLGGGWAGLTAVDVAPTHRRRGVAGALLAAVAQWAGRGGATSTYLQVGDQNDAAIQLYLGAGFAVHHRYDYWRAPAS
jgi:N-acetylglutamate synthase